jgi:hypothetical protein
MGRIHAQLARLWRESSGQGTVEYVGLMLMLAALLGGVIAVTNKGGINGKEIATAIANKLKETIESVGQK